jgi:hypothetical protein
MDQYLSDFRAWFDTGAGGYIQPGGNLLNSDLFWQKERIGIGAGRNNS